MPRGVGATSAQWAREPRGLAVDDAARPDPAAEYGRLLRVPVFAAVTVALGVTGHVLAGGSPPGPAMLALLVAAVGVCWRVVARREQSLPRMLVAVYAVQAGMHVALLSPQGPLTDGSMSMTPAASGPMSGNSVGMWAAHMLAGLAVAAWLRRGESLFWRLVRRVVPRLIFPRAGRTMPDVPAPPLPQGRRVVCPVGARLVLSDPLRGPPLLGLVAPA